MRNDIRREFASLAVAKDCLKNCADLLSLSYEAIMIGRSIV